MSKAVTSRIHWLAPMGQPRLLALAAAALCASAGVSAQVQAQAKESTMEEVVVSASGFEQELKDAPASISVVTRKELETKNFRDLAEALQGVEGIDVLGGTGKTGGLDISIRGMPSDYTLILIDGRRQNVAGDVTPNGFGANSVGSASVVRVIVRLHTGKSRFGRSARNPIAPWMIAAIALGLGDSPVTIMHRYSIDA